MGREAKRPSGLPYPLRELVLARASAQDRAEPERLYQQGVVARKAGRFAEAADRLRRVTELEPKNADAQVQLGLVLAARKSYEPARGAFRKALELAPLYDDARIGLARIAFWKGDLAEARRELAPLGARSPRNADAAALDRQLDKALAAERDKARARSAADEAARAKVAGKAAAEASARIARAKAALAAEAVRKQMAHARDLRLNGRFAEAEAIYRGALRARPRDADSWVGLGLVLAFQSRHPEARAAFDRALTVDSRSLDAKLGLARVDLYTEAFDNAEKRVADVLTQQPRNSDAQSLQARIRLARGDAAGAEQAFRHFTLRNSLDVDAQLGLGDSLRAQLRDDEALQAYRQASAVAPQSADVLARLKIAPRPRWRIDLDGSFSRLTGGLEPWREGSLRVAYLLDPRATLSGGIEVDHRFGRIDTLIDARADYRWSDAISTYWRLGGTPEADFRPEFLAETGGSLRLSKGSNVVGATLATLDLKYARYNTGEVKVASPGLEQHLFGDRLWLTGRFIGTISETGERLGGLLVRADIVATDRLRLFAGYSDAPDSSDGRTIPTQSLFGGAVFDLDGNISLRASFGREEHRRSYTRTIVNLGLSARF